MMFENDIYVFKKWLIFVDGSSKSESFGYLCSVKFYILDILGLRVLTSIMQGTQLIHTGSYLYAAALRKIVYILGIGTHGVYVLLCLFDIMYDDHEFMVWTWCKRE